MFQINFNLLNSILFTGPILAVAAGRRWTHSGFHVFNAVLFLTLILMPFNYGVHVSQILCTILMINLEASLIAAYLQAVELFPTVVRMSGLGVYRLLSEVCVYHYIKPKERRPINAMTITIILFSDHGLCCPLCYCHGKQWGYGMISFLKILDSFTC